MTRARASPTERRGLTIARYTRRTGYPRDVISVVVPVHNEELSVALLYDELAESLAAREVPWEVVFVDDGSTDGTFEALTRLHEAHDNVRAVRLRRNFGKATALDVGFAEAAGEIMVTIDGDLQDDPAEIPRLLAKLDEGYDLVSGWKTKRRDPLTRRIPSRIFNTVAGAVSGVPLHDMNCGLKACRAEVVDGMQLYGELHRYIPVLAHYRGYRVTELPVNHRPREHGSSNYGVERYVRGFLDLLTVTFMGRYRHRPLHLFGGLGPDLGLAGIRDPRLPHDREGDRTRDRPAAAPHAGVLLVVVGIQLLSLGLLSELITSHHEERSGGSDRAAQARRRSAALVVRALGCGSSTSEPTSGRILGTRRSSRPFAAPGWRCVEQNRPVWEQRHNWSVGLRQLIRVAGAECSLRRAGDAGAPADALIVGYPGHFDLPAARRVARGRPVIFNPLVSLYDTLVDDRGRFRRGSPGAGVVHLADRRAFRGQTSSSPTPRPRRRSSAASSGCGTTGSWSASSGPRTGSSARAGNPSARSRCCSSGS